MRLSTQTTSWPRLMSSSASRSTKESGAAGHDRSHSSLSALCGECRGRGHEDPDVESEADVAGVFDIEIGAEFHGPSPRALTCHSPVSPGLTSCLSCCHGWYLATTTGARPRAGQARLACHSHSNLLRCHRRRKRRRALSAARRTDSCSPPIKRNQRVARAVDHGPELQTRRPPRTAIERCASTPGPRLTRTRSATSAMTGAAAINRKTASTLSKQGFQVRTYAPSPPLGAMFFTFSARPTRTSEHQAVSGDTELPGHLQIVNGGGYPACRGECLGCWGEWCPRGA